MLNDVIRHLVKLHQHTAPERENEQREPFNMPAGYCHLTPMQNDLIFE